MTIGTLTAAEDTAAMARTIRQLQARNIVLEGMEERGALERRPTQARALRVVSTPSTGDANG